MAAAEKSLAAGMLMLLFRNEGISAALHVDLHLFMSAPPVCRQTGLVQASASVNSCPMPDNQTSSHTAMTVDMNTVGRVCVCVCLFRRDAVCIVSGGDAFTSQSLK